jgi:hypothetical protein
MAESTQENTEAEEPRGPRALTGEAAAQEEAAAQQRLLNTTRLSPPRAQPTGWRAHARSLLETLWPTAAMVLFNPRPEHLPAGFEPQLAVSASESQEECPICLATLGSCVSTPCGHAFHAACLEHYFNQSRQPGQRSRCPLCRASVHAPLPIEVRAVSGLPIEVTSVPSPGGRCHFDRAYRFIHLGDFDRPGMLFLLSSNEDRKTPSTSPMWIIEASVPCTIHLNFRSERHVAEGKAETWLTRKGFELNTDIRSACSSGIPNGPYVGPIYSKDCEPGTIELNGSATWEGVYFVFVQTMTGGPTGTGNGDGPVEAHAAQGERPAAAAAGGDDAGELQRV